MNAVKDWIKKALKWDNDNPPRWEDEQAVQEWTEQPVTWQEGNPLKWGTQPTPAEWSEQPVTWDNIGEWNDTELPQNVWKF